LIPLRYAGDTASAYAHAAPPSPLIPGLPRYVTSRACSSLRSERHVSRRSLTALPPRRPYCGVPLCGALPRLCSPLRTSPRSSGRLRPPGTFAAMCSAPRTRLRSKVARRGRRSPWYARAWQGIMPSGPLRRRQSAACHAPCVPDPAQKTKQILCARSKTRWLKHTRRLPARGDPSACRIKSCFVPCAPTARAIVAPKPPQAGDVPPPCADGPLRRGRARWSRRPPAAAVHVLARCPALRGVASQPDFVVLSPASWGKGSALKIANRACGGGWWCGSDGAWQDN